MASTLGSVDLNPRSCKGLELSLASSLVGAELARSGYPAAAGGGGCLVHPALGRELWETSVRNLRWEPGSCQLQRAPTAFGGFTDSQALGTHGEELLGWSGA